MAESFYLNVPNYNVYMAFSGNLSPDETNSLFEHTASSDANFVSGFYAHETLAQIQKADPTFSPPALNVSESRLQLPQYQRWSLEWQQAIGARTSANVGYFGHHGIHELNVNPSANAYCDLNAPDTPCPGFHSSLPMTVPDTRFSQVAQYHSRAVLPTTTDWFFSFDISSTAQGAAWLRSVMRIATR